jgi:hypothetical protein
LLDNPTLVMFDGLDEVFDRPTQATIIDDIIRFAQQYPQARILVTSRIIGYQPERFQHAGFRQFTIQPLDESEINEFIDRWYDLSMGSDPDKVRLKQRLTDAIANSKAIRNLADNPLLLTMMAILNRRQEFPRDRADLYDQASRVLLYHWDVDHKRLNLPLDAIGRREKQEMLRLIAYEMQAGEEGLKGNLISSDRFITMLTSYLRDQGFSDPREKANTLIQQLRERNFILCYRGADTYGFMHRTFLEYFCAVEIVHRFEKQRTLTFNQLRDEVFGQHWQDETWHEVLKLITSMIEGRFSDQLTNDLLRQDHEQKEYSFLNIVFAAECFYEIRSGNKETEEHVIKSLKNLVEYNLNAGDYWLSIIELKIKSITIISKTKKNRSSLLWLDSLLVSERELFLKDSILQVIAKYFCDFPETLSILKKHAEDEKDPRIRRIALEELIRIAYREGAESRKGVETTDIFDFLCDRILKDPFENEVDALTINPRKTALRALLKNHPKHFKAIELLRICAVNDPDEQLRQWSQEQLRKLGGAEE